MLNNGEAELLKLSDDLSGRVSLEATSAIVGIFRTFIECGYTATTLFPVLSGSEKELQNLMLASVMASLFYAERQMKMAMNHMLNKVASVGDITLDQCEKLFQFSQDLAFDFKTQMILLRNDEKTSSAKKRLN